MLSSDAERRASKHARRESLFPNARLLRQAGRRHSGLEQAVQRRRHIAVRIDLLVKRGRRCAGRSGGRYIGLKRGNILLIEAVRWKRIVCQI